MGLELQSGIKPGEIKIEFDSGAQKEVDKILNEWGSAIPLVKINDYVLKIGEVESCSINVGINKLPTFNIVVDDYTFKIRNNLKHQIDTCVIFFGYQNWYVKFTGLITNISSFSGSYQLFIDGILYVEPLYVRSQKLYKDQTIKDIIKSVCVDTKLGLYTFDNDELLNTPNLVINPNQSNIDFLKSLITTYTDNVYSIDTFGFLHIGDIETILKQPTDTYSISYKDGSKITETPLIFRTTNVAGDNDDNKIPIDAYTIDQNFALSQLGTQKQYTVYSDKQSKQLKTFEQYGFGEFSDNTFDGFLNHRFPQYTARVNKLLCGNLIKLKLRNIVYEVVPFTVCELELWLSRNIDDAQEVQLDSEHSGKHMIIGYSFDYVKSDSADQNHITQTILMI